MTHSAVDRRILRAFYTQYVSVLLIVLVFGIWAFQRSSQPLPADGELSAWALRVPPVGEMILEDPFAGERGASIHTTSQLDAVIELLKNHDVRGVFHIPQATQFAAPSTDAPDILLRIDALRSVLMHQGVPAEAIRVLVEGGTRQSPKMRVSFEMTGRPREQS